MNREVIIFEAEEPTEVYKPGLIEYLARETAKNMDDYVFNLIRQNKELQCKVNQLETNRDEVIELLRSNNIEVLKYYDEPSETGSYEIVTIKILSLLERGKE